MYLKLTAASGNSFISVMVDGIGHISTQQVHESDVKDMIASFQKTGRFEVMINHDGGNTTYVIREKEQTLSANEAEAKKLTIEFLRFKQDCRKKALEFAETDHDASKMTVSERLNRAGLYYKWLTEIPEPK